MLLAVRKNNVWWFAYFTGRNFLNSRIWLLSLWLSIELQAHLWSSVPLSLPSWENLKWVSSWGAWEGRHVFMEQGSLLCTQRVYLLLWILHTESVSSSLPFFAAKAVGPARFQSSHSGKADSEGSLLSHKSVFLFSELDEGSAMVLSLHIFGDKETDPDSCSASPAEHLSTNYLLFFFFKA